MASDRWAGRTVAVTGGLGFVGSHFVERLLTEGARVICLCRTIRGEVLREFPETGRLTVSQVDLCDRAATRAVFARDDIDTVVHCAAMHGNSAFKTRQPASILENDARMALNVLGCARDHDVAEVVVQSSSVVYSGHRGATVDEETRLSVSEEDAGNGYVHAHLFTETVADLFRRQYGMTVFVPRATNVYGPRDGLGASPSVIPDMIRRVRDGGEVEIWGDGGQTRDFLYVTDLVRTTLRMVDAGKHHTVNLGTGQPVRILDLARLVFALTGRPERIRLDPAKSAGSGGAVLDLGRMHDLDPCAPLGLREGLDRTIRWYHETHRSTQ